MSFRRIIQFLLAIALALSSAGISGFCAIARSLDPQCWQYQLTAALTVVSGALSLAILIIAIFSRDGSPGLRKRLATFQQTPGIAPTAVALTAVLGVTSIALTAYTIRFHNEGAEVRAHLNERVINRALIIKLVETERLAFGETGGLDAYAKYANANSLNRRTLPESQWGYEQALECDKRRKGTAPHEKIYILVKLAEAQTQMRKFNSAEERLTEALKCIEDTSSAYKHDRIMQGLRLDCLSGLAAVYYQQSDYEKAAYYEQQVVNERNKVGDGAAALDIGPLEQLADLYVKLHHYEAAEPLARQAVDFYTAQTLSTIGTSSDTTANLASSYRRLATILRGRNHAREAEAFEARASAIEELK